MENNLKQEAVQVLKSYNFDLKTDANYHGIDVDILGKIESIDKKIFMYIVDDEPSLGHVINLSNIKEGNKKVLRNTLCHYVIFASEIPDEETKILSEKTEIPIYTNIEDFSKDISSYLKN